METDALSLGSVWSSGPSYTDISRTSTETITTGGKRTMSTDTGYMSKVKTFMKNRRIKKITKGKGKRKKRKIKLRNG